MVYILFLINVEYMFENLFLHPKTAEFLKIFAFDEEDLDNDIPDFGRMGVI